MGAYRKFSAVDKASSKTYQIQIVIGGRVVYCSWSAAWMSEFNYSCYCYLLPVFSVARGWFFTSFMTIRGLMCCGSRALVTGRRISGSGRLLTSPTVCCWQTSRQTLFSTAPSTFTSAALSAISSGCAFRRCSCAEIAEVRAASRRRQCWWNRPRRTPSWWELP